MCFTINNSQIYLKVQNKYLKSNHKLIKNKIKAITDTETNTKSPACILFSSSAKCFL